MRARSAALISVLVTSLAALILPNSVMANPGLSVLAVHGGVLARAPLDSKLSAVVKLNTRFSIVDYALCTGTFISDRLLVTAAHCFTRDPEAAEPCLATEGCTATAQSVTAETPAASPSGDYFMEAGESRDWVLDKEHDLAIVRFPAGTFTGKPIPYRVYTPELQAELEAGHATYKALGYGTTETGASGDGLRCSTTIPVLELGPLNFISRDEFRVDHGDSGGPVLAYLPGKPPFIVGINDAYDPDHPEVQYFKPLRQDFFASQVVAPPAAPETTPRSRRR